MLTSRTIDAGPLLVLGGAVLLLIALFLPWYEPSLEAWTIFEVLDLLLAAAAVVAIMAALGLLAGFPSAPDPRVLPWASGVAFLLVCATLLNRPPVVGPGEHEVGIWLALAGSALMAAGTVLRLARVSIALDIAARDRDRPEPAAGSGAAPASGAATGQRAGGGSGAPARPVTGSSGGAGATPDAPLFAGDEETQPTEPMRPAKD